LPKTPRPLGAEAKADAEAEAELLFGNFQMCVARSQKQIHTFPYTQAGPGPEKQAEVANWR